MKASELVALLNAEIEKYGDFEVKYKLGNFDATPWLIKTYTKDGYTPTTTATATQIYIH